MAEHDDQQVVKERLTDSATASSSASLYRLDCFVGFRVAGCLLRGEGPVRVVAPAPKLPDPPLRR